MTEDERQFFRLHRRADRNRKRWARLGGKRWSYAPKAGRVTLQVRDRHGYRYVQQALSFELLSDTRMGPRKLLAYIWRDLRVRLRESAEQA